MISFKKIKSFKKMKSCGMNTIKDIKYIKYILFFFNLIFVISGIGIIAAGIRVMMDAGTFSYFVENRFFSPPIVLIIVGGIVFFTAFFGCFGAINESYYMLMVFVAALLFIFIAELTAGIAAAVYKNNFAMILKNSMNDSIMNYGKLEQVAWTKVQDNLECCGVDSSSDWSQVSQSRLLPPGLLPRSCCKNLSSENQCELYDPSIYKTGCYAALEMRVQKSASVLIGVGISIAFIQITGIVMACSLAITIKKEYVDK